MTITILPDSSATAPAVEIISAVMLPPAATALLTTPFSALVDDISAFVPGCPSPVIERTIRKIAVDLCQRGKVWEADLAPVTLTAGEYSYVLASPVEYGEVTDLLNAAITTADSTSRVSLRWIPLPNLRLTRPSWPTDDAGQPMYISTNEPNELVVAPVPEANLTLTMRAVLRPTATATEWPSYLHDEYKRVLFHGSIHELLMMPGRSWSTSDKQSAATAQYHGKQWTYLLNAARHRTATGYNARSLSVQMTPFA